MKKLSILLLAMVALLFVGMYNAPAAQAAETNVSFDVTVVEDGDIVTLPALTGQYGKNMSFDAGGLLVGNMEFAYHILNGKVIESPTHNVLVSGSSNLIVVIQSVGTEVTTFIDVNGKLLDANTTGQAPLNVPLKPGFDFDGFVDLEGTDKPVKVATYTRKTDVATIAVTVNGGSKDLVEVKYNDVVTLQPADMDNFKYWADANGKFVSSKPNYKFTALKDVTFEAVTVGDVPALTSVYMTSVDIRDGHESYLAQIELKEGESLLEYGYLTSETEMGDIVVGASGVEKVSSTALNPLTNEFLMSFPLVKFLNIRAYALVDNGTTQIYVYNELPGSFASDLFISEYIEGSSSNKAIEIYNGTGKTVNLDGYSLRLYANGATNASNTENLSGTLSHGDVLVLGNSNSVEALSSKFNISSSVANFNGDDVIELRKNDSIIDVIGLVGSQTKFGENVTLVRNSNITSGNPTYTVSEWTSYPNDTFDYVGNHNMSGGLSTLSDSQSILKDALEIHEFAEIKENGFITLKDTGNNGTVITWSSSNPSIINVDTKEVNIPLETQESVILTATISKGGLSKTVDREVMVGLSDADRLAIENSIIAELELVDGSQFAGGSDVSLPSEIEGINILWTYNPSNLVVDGKFIEVEEDTSLTLTATFTVPGRPEKSLEMPVTIMASGGVEYVDEIWNWTIGSSIANINKDNSLVYSGNTVSWMWSGSNLNTGMYTGYDGTKGQQIGSGKQPARGTISFNITLPEGSVITGYSISASVASGGATVLSHYGNDTNLTTNNTAYSQMGLIIESNSFSFSMTNTSAAMYFKNVTVYYKVPQ